MLYLLSIASILPTLSLAAPSGTMYGRHFEGDIAMRNRGRFASTGILRAFVNNKELRWSKTIQYTIGTDLVNHTKIIRQCLDWITERSCLKFIQGSTGDHIKFTSFGDNDNDGTGCWSYFGRRGGEQVVNLEIPGCVTKDTIYHEVFHALGKVHEQSRPDRDQHVDVLLENVMEGQEDQFEIKKNVDTAGTGYDLQSIMHYEATAFSKNGLPTIQAKNSKATFGETEEPTDIDLKELNIAYGCKLGVIDDSTEEESGTEEGEEGPVYYYLSEYLDYPNVYNEYGEIPVEFESEGAEYEGIPVVFESEGAEVEGIPRGFGSEEAGYEGISVGFESEASGDDSSSYLDSVIVINETGSYVD